MIKSTTGNVNGVNGASYRQQGGGGVAPGRWRDEAPSVVNKRNPQSVGFEKLKIRMVNVGSMAKRSGEVAEMVGRRGLDFCCLQEMRWRGEGVRMIGGKATYLSFTGKVVNMVLVVWEFWLLRSGQIR